MKKLIKYAGGAGLLTSLIYLYHAHTNESTFKQIKMSTTELKQLFNRLIEQLKDTKRSSVKLKNSLQKINLTQIKDHLNQFTSQIQPELQKLHTTTKEINDHNHN